MSHISQKFLFENVINSINNNPNVRHVSHDQEIEFNENSINVIMFEQICT